MGSGSQRFGPKAAQRAAALIALCAALLCAPAVLRAQPEEGSGAARDVQLDFNDVELPVVIDTIARLTGDNYIYDDRVRGRVTIVSPTKMTRRPGVRGVRVGAPGQGLHARRA